MNKYTIVLFWIICITWGYSIDTLLIINKYDPIPIQPKIIYSNTHPKNGEKLIITIVEGLWPDDCTPPIKNKLSDVTNPGMNSAGVINLKYEIDSLTPIDPSLPCTDFFTPFGPIFSFDSLNIGLYNIVVGKDTIDNFRVEMSDKFFSISANVLKYDSISGTISPYDDFRISLRKLEPDYIPSGFYSIIKNDTNTNGDVPYIFSELPGKAYQLKVTDNKSDLFGQTLWFNLKSDTTINFLLKDASLTALKGRFKKKANKIIQKIIGHEFILPQEYLGKKTVLTTYDVDGRFLGNIKIDGLNSVINLKEIIGSNQMSVIMIE